LIRSKFRQKSRKAQSGFTLIELVVTITLLGVVGMMGVQSILPIVRGYVDARIVDRLYNEAKFSVERMDRELRMAIPNTVRPVTDNTGIQFGKLKKAGYYSTGPADRSQIEILEPLTINDQLSIYNTNPNFFYFDSTKPTESRIYTIDSLLGGNILQLNNKLKKDSPNRRYYQIDTPVTFYYSDNKLLRNFNYSIDINEYGTGGDGNALATKVYSATFTYSPETMHRNAYIDIRLIMEEGDITLEYNHRIHVRNTP